MSQQHIDWKIRSDNWQKFCQLHIDEIERLKAEVEELKRMLEASTFGIEFAKEDIKKLEAENACLKAEVERLRKAGDALALSVGADWAINGPDDGTEPESVNAWNAAKEGKQS